MSNLKYKIPYKDIIKVDNVIPFPLVHPLNNVITTRCNKVTKKKILIDFVCNALQLNMLWFTLRI